MEIMRCVKFIRCPIWLHSMLSNGNPNIHVGGRSAGGGVGGRALGLRLQLGLGLGLWDVGVWGCYTFVG